MPELKCMVSTCGHNKDCCCNLDEVKVGGKNADSACKTCCDSFVERKDGDYENSLREASPECRIKCEVSQCRYNDKCSCTAGCVNVQGMQACTCKETECSTFCSKS